jgi:hypothetical protein
MKKKFKRSNIILPNVYQYCDCCYAGIITEAGCGQGAKILIYYLKKECEF